MAHDITLNLADESATLAAGAHIAQAILPGLTIYFHGNLGAGKTTFVRGMLQGLGHEGKVKSPTYTLVEPYQLKGISLYHFDLYRFADPEEWEAAGFREYFNPQSICLVEWPEKAETLLPDADLDIVLQAVGAGRQMRLVANTDLGKRVIESYTPA